MHADECKIKLQDGEGPETLSAEEKQEIEEQKQEQNGDEGRENSKTEENAQQPSENAA